MKVKVIADSDNLPLAASQYAGCIGEVVEKDINVGGDLYNKVRFEGGQERSYLAYELEIVED